MNLHMERTAQHRSHIPSSSTLICVSTYSNDPDGSSKITDMRTDKFKEAFTELGLPIREEAALGDATGALFVPSDINPEDATRSSSLYAYYDKVSARTNLKLQTLHQG